MNIFTQKQKKLHPFFAWICAFIFALGISLFPANSKTVSATSTENGYFLLDGSKLSVSSFPSEGEFGAHYDIQFTYNTTNFTHGKSYALYLLPEITLETDKGDIPIEQISGYGNGKVVFSFSSKWFVEENITCFKFPKGLQIERKEINKTDYDGFEFDRDTVFYKTADGNWTQDGYVTVNKTVEGEETQTRVATANTEYCLGEATGNGVCIGWKIGGKLYPKTHTVNINDYAQTGLKMQAVFLNFSLKEGASVRYALDGKSGIRFSAECKKDEENSINYVQALGAIVMPADLIGENEFVWENYQGAGQAKNYIVNAENFDFDTNGRFSLYASVAPVQRHNYERVFASRAYVLIEYETGTEYVYTRNVEMRSIAEIARTLLEKDEREKTLQDWQIEILNGYIPTENAPSEVD